MSEHPRDSTATRERLLNSYQQLIIDHGERAATLDAVAREAGVSKGGLLYHFPSKEALNDGMINRLDEMVEQDIITIRTAPDGAVEYFLRSCVVTDSPYDHAISATIRLAQLPHAAAADAVDRMRARWVDVLAEATGDRDLAVLVAVAGEGIYTLAGHGGGPEGSVATNELAPILRVLARTGATAGAAITT
ncbi:MAG: TetR/AcrR family transcriptional regulator [Mycetocola sp.]